MANIHSSILISSPLPVYGELNDLFSQFLVLLHFLDDRVYVTAIWPLIDNIYVQRVSNTDISKSFDHHWMKLRLPLHLTPVINTNPSKARTTYNYQPFTGCVLYKTFTVHMIVIT